METPLRARLAEKLIELNETLTPLESFNMNLLMSVAVGGIAPFGGVPTEGIRAEAWETGLRVLAHMRPRGLRFVGNAPFLTPELLATLQAEAREQETISHRTGPHELSPGGEHAVRLSSAPEVLDFMSKEVGHPMFPTEIGTYLYYTKPGDHLYPHVDTEVFAANLIIMLEHEVPAGMSHEEGSALIVYEPDKGERRIPLRVGESAVLLASGTVHGREALKEGERVTIATIGFQHTGVDLQNDD
jgi:hypothetical protein